MLDRSSTVDSDDFQSLTLSRFARPTNSRPHESDGNPIDTFDQIREVDREYVVGTAGDLHDLSESIDPASRTDVRKPLVIEAVGMDGLVIVAAMRRGSNPGSAEEADPGIPFRRI